MTVFEGLGISTLTNSDQAQKPISLSDIQDAVKKIETLGPPPDDCMWMRQATIDELFRQLEIPAEKLEPHGMGWYTLTVLGSIKIYADEETPVRMIESGTYEKNPRTPTGIPFRKIVRHRYTI
jgi:hypothetical protein